MSRPEFRYVFTLRNGDTLTVLHRDAKRTLDKRTDQAYPEIVWEVNDGGKVRRLWAEDIADWRQEEL